MTAGHKPLQPIDARQRHIDEDNPWPGLGAFDEAAQRFFNGRRKEAAELRRLVLDAPLTVVFGASGLGKTSLLQAGLFPLLRRENVLPIYVRLDVRERSRPLIDQVASAMAGQFNVQRVDGPLFGEGTPLWEWLHRDGLELWSQRNQLLTPLFVIDQFEEVFTLGAENVEAIARLRVDLSDLIENRIPTEVAARIRANEAAESGLSLSSHRYKVLLSFREDFLPAVEGWKRDVPSIMRNRLRLLPMSIEQAFEAVHMTAPHLAGEKIAREIVRFVAAALSTSPADFNESDLAVEPALLSLVCHGLNERRKARGKSVFDSALLEGTGQAIVADYYQNAVRDLPERVQRFIENELITERGFRKQYDVDDARSIHGVTDRELRLLVDRRLLRLEPHRRTESVELTHDLLTGVVRESRERQREIKRGRQRRKRVAMCFALVSVPLLLLTLYNHQRTQEAERDRQSVIENLKQIERRHRQLAGTIAEEQEQLASLKEDVARGRRTAPELAAAIDSAQQTLAATRAGIENDPIAVSVRELNDASVQVRRSAGQNLAGGHSSNPIAIGLVLDTLSPQRFGSLSLQGRINSLSFLNSSNFGAWTDEHKRLAREAIARIRAGDAAGRTPLGQQARDELDKLDRKLGQ